MTAILFRGRWVNSSPSGSKWSFTDCCLMTPYLMEHLGQHWFRQLFIICLVPIYDDVIKWKHFPRYWPFVQGIHWSLVNSPHKGQWHRALMFSLICAWINGWVNNHEAGDLRRHPAHYDVIVMSPFIIWSWNGDILSIRPSVKCVNHNKKPFMQEDQFHTKILHLKQTTTENEINI